MIPQVNMAGFVGLISRPKMIGPGTHAGVLLPSGNVAHLTPEGASIVSFAQFSQGKPVRADKAADRAQYQQIEWRAWHSLGRTLPYELLNRNCEHYANFVMGQKPESPQVIGALLLSILGLVFVAAR